jgi:hypothetical protein
MRRAKTGRSSAHDQLRRESLARLGTHPLAVPILVDRLAEQRVTVSLLERQQFPGR